MGNMHLNLHAPCEQSIIFSKYVEPLNPYQQKNYCINISYHLHENHLACALFSGNPKFVGYCRASEK